MSRKVTTLNSRSPYGLSQTITDENGAATTLTIDVNVNHVSSTITKIISDIKVSEGEETNYQAIA